MKTIEELKEHYNTSDAVFAGVKVSEHWKQGKHVDDKVYIDAVEKFLKSPVDEVEREEAKG